MARAHIIKKCSSAPTYDGLTPKVSEAFGHHRSGTEELERQLWDAVAEATTGSGPRG